MRGRFHKSRVGETFDKWTLIKRVENKNKSTYYLAKCTCGTIQEVDFNSLIRKKNPVKSCGCIMRLEKGESSKRTLYKTYKKKAEEKNREFILTYEEFVFLTSQNCTYCDNPPSNILTRKRSNGEYIYNGLDRVDNERGYTHNNVVTCCETCNRAKLKMGKEEFLNWIEKVYNHSVLKALVKLEDKIKINKLKLTFKN